MVLVLGVRVRILGGQLNFNSMKEKDKTLDQPNPDGGASSYELGRALGMNMDEALDFQNDIEKIAKENE